MRTGGSNPLLGVGEEIYPPTQKTTGGLLCHSAYGYEGWMTPGMNAPGLRSLSGSFGGVDLDGPSVARRAKEGELLRRTPLKKIRIPRTQTRGASLTILSRGRCC